MLWIDTKHLIFLKYSIKTKEIFGSFASMLYLCTRKPTHPMHRRKEKAKERERK